MRPIWGLQDPGGPHIGPMNLTTWESNLQNSMKVDFFSITDSFAMIWTYLAFDDFFASWIQLMCPYNPELLHWHLANRMIASVPVNHSNAMGKSFGAKHNISLQTNNICTYFVGSTVMFLTNINSLWPSDNLWLRRSSLDPVMTCHLLYIKQLLEPMLNHLSLWNEF